MRGWTPVAPQLHQIEFRPTTRAAFLLRGALAAGAAYGANAVGPWVMEAFAQDQGQQNAGAGDVEILNFALTLEHLEATYYARALKELSLSGPVKALTQEIADNEAAHVAFLSGAIKTFGAKPAKPPEVAFPYTGEAKFLQLAQTFEDTGVMAYNGAAPFIESKAILNNAGKIAQVEGRHAGAIRFLRGKGPAPAALDGVLDFQEVIATVKPYLKSMPFSFRQAEPGRGPQQYNPSTF